ncbi:hypothetical protein HBH56_094660 [Parastagonospora nodorum]|uniref:Uncharacterized protein n=1 Tax=Phaeosphaeria nodorum (strain SN15 / ATCC MYA-4574 / FGSC 10173) TaxID=321614 RepID=A0A7U2NQY4_PHANO|nr:hypothetical protein HBH56_094660 [Parastagonospora nodorum]QRD07108.1 hypothetical protein JI435_446910 [Parastagonospora nodorum SN15]KAH3930448.1 hypothetical protein HBH54_108980 [Parastagonospora nodorum]KAH4027062.1 hypothetical protein HBI09_147660 [Parastagonospora nodorum]KAH4124879.1 hypothetical protein HBH45_233680 [Parastagonospora nodorum]
MNTEKFVSENKEDPDAIVNQIDKNGENRKQKDMATMNEHKGYLNATFSHIAKIAENGKQGDINTMNKHNGIRFSE